MRSEGLLRSLLILAVTAALTIIVIDLAIASKPALMGTHVGLGGKGRGGAEGSATPSYGKVYEVMVRDNARALQYASTPGAVGAGVHAIDKSPESSLTLWSTDFHISPIADIKAIIEGLNREAGRSVVNVIDKSLSGHCHLTGTCAGSDLKVITKENGIDLGACPNKLRRDFYTHYSTDPQFALNTDVVVCTHAASLCELYMPFDKALIVIASTRYEIGRHSKERWEQWSDNLRRISQKDGNYVAANNLYDKYYIEYFTGIKNVLLLPSLATYIKDRAFSDPTLHMPDEAIVARTEVLLAPARDVDPGLRARMMEALHAFNAKNGKSNNARSADLSQASYTGDTLRIEGIRELYPHFKYSDLAAHPACVLIPYQVSFMTMFELYRIGLPLFVPSSSLLARWHVDVGMLKERTWATVFGDSQGRKRSVVDKSTLSNSTASSSYVSQFLRGGWYTASHSHYDPNDEESLDAVHSWVVHADFYTWPHIHTFDSWEQLFVMLHGGSMDTEEDDVRHLRVDLKRTSEQMQEAMAVIEAEGIVAWRAMIARLQKLKKQKTREKRNYADSGGSGRWTAVNTALQQRYGYRLDPESCLGTTQFH